jgi:hypothetical protein
MNRCAECKGKGLCGRPRCPIVSRFQASLSTKPSDTYMGEAPSVFVGSRGFPRMIAGPLLTGEADSPKEWLRRGYSIEDIVGVRARTIRGSGTIASVEDAIHEVALSPVPVDVEARFDRPVRFDLSFDGTMAPVGMKGSLAGLAVLDNAKPERPVDRVTSDNDLRASDAIRLLYDEGIDEHRITQLLSAGLLGVKRHAVPTRWAITAVDDMLSVGLRVQIARAPSLDTIRLFSAEIFANQIIALLVPGAWRFEMIEQWEKQSIWSPEAETIIVDGEKNTKRDYSPIAGAYYSGRLGVQEYLTQNGCSARVLLIRRIRSDYWAPLGTWVIREAVRQAMKGKPETFESLDAAVRRVCQIMGSRQWLRHSTLIPEIRTQRTLFDFSTKL